LQGDGVEEFESGTNLAVSIVGRFLDFDAVQEELSDLRFPEFGRRASKEGGELAAVEEVIACGGGAEIAEEEVLGHAVVKLSYGLLLVKEKKRVHQEVKHMRRLRKPAAGEDRNHGRGTRLLPQLPLRIRSTPRASARVRRG
jgi:hypothetical protein